MENRDNHNTRDDDDNAKNFTTEAKGSKANADDLTKVEKNDNARVDTIEITTKKTTMVTEQG